MSRVTLALVLVGACTPARKIEPLGSVYVLEVDVRAADGATLEVTEEDSPALAGARLVIPPGALATDTRVTITIGPDIPEDGASPAGPTVEIGPLNTSLDPQAELTLPLTTVPPPALARVYARDAEGPQPTRMPDGLAIGTENGAPVVRLAIDTFLAFQPAAATDACAGRTCPIGSVCRNGGCYPACNTALALRHIMFVVDQTPSVATSDPTNARLDAIIDVIDSFVIDPTTSQLEDGVSFAILGFRGDAIAYTESSPGVPGFSSDGVAVKAAVTQLAASGAEETAYDRALATASDFLDVSMNALSPVDRARAAYQVMLVSDGAPTGAVCDGDANAPGAAVRRVEALVETAAFHDVWLQVSTTLVADPLLFPVAHDPAEIECMKLDRTPFVGIHDCAAPVTTGDVTGCVLGALARAGGGSLSKFSDVEPVDFGAFDFEPTVSTPCPDGFECQPSHSLCMPRTPDSAGACTTDQDCQFRSVCVAGACITDEFGCGNACQPTPDEPLKVLFALDASAGLAAADPEGATRRAIRDAIAATSAAYPHAAFRVVGYHSETLGSPGTTGCPAFSRNPTALLLFVNALTATELRDIQGVLNVAREDLRRDMNGVIGRTGCDLTQAGDELAHTHYAVVLISAGLPEPTCTLGLDNDFDPQSPADPYPLCEDADYVSCLLKRDLDAGGTECTYGTCTDGAALCAYEGHTESACCDTDDGWDGLDEAPHQRLFGGLGGESELRGGGAYNQPFQLDARVRSLIALREQRGVASIRLHTVHVPPAAAVDDGTAALLARLASTGRGLALTFPGGAGASFAALGLDTAPASSCADRVPEVTCGTPPPACPSGTYPEHSDLQSSECGVIATWTGACLPC